MAGKAIATEHSGAKHGNGAYWGRKVDAKHESDKARREADRREEQAFEREAYLGLADELSAIPTFLDEADETYVTAGETFALRLGLPWPPVADLDVALDLVGRAEYDLALGDPESYR